MRVLLTYTHTHTHTHTTHTGNNCCPLLKSTVQASLVLQDSASPGTVTLKASDLSQFEAMRDKPEVIAFRQAMAQIEGLMTVQNVNVKA